MDTPTAVFICECCVGKVRECWSSYSGVVSMSSTYINNVTATEPQDTDSLMAYNAAQTLELRDAPLPPPPQPMGPVPCNRFREDELVIGGKRFFFLKEKKFLNTSS